VRAELLASRKEVETKEGERQEAVKALESAAEGAARTASEHDATVAALRSEFEAAKKAAQTTANSLNERLERLKKVLTLTTCGIIAFVCVSMYVNFKSSCAR
jgi:ABC-type transporter Mla subunit MlaD